MSDDALSLQAERDLVIGGDVVGRDKIVNNIQNIVQRALTAAETATQERELERQELARGVGAFARNLQARAGVGTVSRGNPYKGLLTYRLADSALFFGRTRALAEVGDRLSRGALTILHSESGAGKSSLLQAGIMPQLIGRGHLPIYLRPYQMEPYLAIKRAFLPDLGVAPLLTTGPLRDFLRQVTEILGPECRLYIFLDQAEELFTQLSEVARAEFVRELADCLNDETLNVRWVLAMRTEFFGELANFRPHIRDPFANDYRLNRLTLDEAREVVVEPARWRATVYEPGLVDALLHDLGQAEFSPPEIQLVCSALYDDLPPAEKVELRTITRAMYDGQGGAQGILRDHLERVLGRDVPAESRPAARRLLEALIRSDGRRVIRPRSAVMQELTTFALTPAAFDTLVSQLVDSRLLRSHEPNQQNPEPGYELTHDYLAAKINIDPAVQARKAAQELMDQETANYTKFGTLLDEDKLAILEQRVRELTLTPEGEALLRRSRAAMRRRRGVLVGGSVIAVVLLVVGVFSVLTAISAQSQLGQADAALGQASAALGTAQAEGTRVSQEQLLLEDQAAQAAIQAALSQNQQATAVAAVTQAAAEAANLQTLAADLQRQADAAEGVVRNLFEKNQLVPVEPGPQAMTVVGDQIWLANSGNNTLQRLDPASGATGSPIAVGRNPTALLYDGQRLWVANTEDDTVEAIDPATGAEAVPPIPVGRSPLGLAFDGQLLWVSNGDDDAVQAIDPQTRQVVATLPVGDRPYALAFDGAKIWVGNWSSSTLQVIDPATRAVEPGAVAVGARPVALLFAGERLWVANQSDRVRQVQVVDVATRSVLNVDRPITVGLNPVAMAYNPVDEQLWVSVQNEDAIRPVNPRTWQVGALARVGRVPTGLAYANGRIWVANNGDNSVQVVDPRLGNLSAPIAVGEAPRAAFFDPATGRLWLTYQNDQSLQALEVATGRLGQRYRVGAEPRSLAYDGARLWVVNGGANSVQAVNPATNLINAAIPVQASARTVVFDGREIWVVTGRGGPDGRGTVQPIDVDSRQTAAAPIPVGLNPTALFFDGTRLWVANSTDNTVQWIAPGIRQAGATIQVDNFPNAFALAGGLLWVANQNSNTVQGIDTRSETVVVTLTVNTAPIDLLFDGELLWVANYTAKTVQSIDVANRLVGPAIPVDSRPRALAFDGQRLWIVNQDGNNVQFLQVRD